MRVELMDSDDNEPRLREIAPIYAAALVWLIVLGIIAAVIVFWK